MISRKFRSAKASSQSTHSTEWYTAVGKFTVSYANTVSESAEIGLLGSCKNKGCLAYESRKSSIMHHIRHHLHSQKRAQSTVQSNKTGRGLADRFYADAHQRWLRPVSRGRTRHGCAPKPGILLHSDHGSEYTSLEMQLYMQKYGKKRSFSRMGNCWNNAPIERFFRHCKAELRSVPISRSV